MKICVLSRGVYRLKSCYCDFSLCAFALTVRGRTWYSSTSFITRSVPLVAAWQCTTLSITDYKAEYLVEINYKLLDRTDAKSIRKQDKSYTTQHKRYEINHFRLIVSNVTTLGKASLLKLLRSSEENSTVCKRSKTCLATHSKETQILRSDYVNRSKLGSCISVLHSSPVKEKKKSCNVSWENSRLTCERYVTYFVRSEIKTERSRKNVNVRS